MVGILYPDPIDELLRGFARMTFSVREFLHGPCDLLSHIVRPFLGGVKGNHAHWIRIFAREDFARDGRLISLRFVGFDIGATKRAKIVEHNADGDIVTLLARSKRGVRMTEHL